jgi:ankyrin repeat protein
MSFSSNLTFRLFLAFGADFNTRDLDGNTCLHWASFSKCPDCTRLLLDVGCPVNGQNTQGDTALHIASRRNHQKVAYVLLQWGASLDIKNACGSTPRELSILLTDKNNMHGWHGLTSVINKNTVDMAKDDLPDEVLDLLVEPGKDVVSKSAGFDV